MLGEGRTWASLIRLQFVQWWLIGNLSSLHSYSSLTPLLVTNSLIELLLSSDTKLGGNFYTGGGWYREWSHAFKYFLRGQSALSSYLTLAKISNKVEEKVIVSSERVYQFHYWEVNSNPAYKAKSFKILYLKYEGEGKIRIFMGHRAILLWCNL